MLYRIVLAAYLLAAALNLVSFLWWGHDGDKLLIVLLLIAMIMNHKAVGAWQHSAVRWREAAEDWRELAEMRWRNKTR